MVDQATHQPMFWKVGELTVKLRQLRLTEPDATGLKVIVVIH